ncbi:SDR family oxidoreductase [Nonomuraea sp. NPDC050022]|uniref:SDR family oxidoreductase n=1 Tax=Nonomuraea sp. NPDC050022 TaxID=3364358 RepID=UPI0037B87B07
MTVTYDYTGKVVLVTGGTRGIGAGIATAFAAAGAEVIVCARHDPSSAPLGTPSAVDASSPTPPPSVVDAAPAEGVRFVRADVRDADDLERLFSGLDRLDVVVNNAGGSPYALLEGTSPRLHTRVVELNLIAPMLVAQRAHPLLAASGGSVVMIGSSSGVRPSPGTSAYGAAKAGLHHLANCLAAEWAPDVRVNTVVVGLAATEDSADHYGGKDVGTAIPAGRMATPADVASVCLWLAAPGYVTGAQVHVHGGGEIPAWQNLASSDIS